MSELKTQTAKEIKDEAVDAIEAGETLVLKARTLASRGARAYVGLWGLAYDTAAKRIAKLGTKLGEGREELMDDLVARGEVIERQALVAANDAKARVVKFTSERTETIRDILPTREARVEELQAEVEKLSKTIKAMKTKTAKTAKTTTKVTPKTTAKKVSKAA